MKCGQEVEGQIFIVKIFIEILKGNRIGIRVKREKGIKIVIETVIGIESMIAHETVIGIEKENMSVGMIVIVLEIASLIEIVIWRNLIKSAIVAETEIGTKSMILIGTGTERQRKLRIATEAEIGIMRKNQRNGLGMLYL